ncbi:MAG: hypothetical protein HY074_20975 [Deltaproteobacteria bacterium]|nr:hypothetical protein [Deltaproteobacteria bacterium]
MRASLSIICLALCAMSSQISRADCEIGPKRVKHGAEQVRKGDITPAALQKTDPDHDYSKAYSLAPGTFDVVLFDPSKLTPVQRMNYEKEKRLAQEKEERDEREFSTAVQACTVGNSTYPDFVAQSECLYDLTRTQPRATNEHQMRASFAAASAAEKALKVHDSGSEALYWHGLSIARWSESNGILRALSKRKDVMHELKLVLAANPTYDNYGASRALSKIYANLPPMFGGDEKRALELMESVHAENVQASRFAENDIQLAYALALNGRYADGEKILNELLAVEKGPEEEVSTGEARKRAVMLEAKQLKKELSDCR